MRFLLDAHLPAGLAVVLRSAGHEAMHTSELPNGNRSTYEEIIRVADEAGLVVVSKDSDFRDSHRLRGRPRLLLIVATGNISNRELSALFVRHLDEIAEAFAVAALVEIARDRMVIHDR